MKLLQGSRENASTLHVLALLKIIIKLKLIKKFLWSATGKDGLNHAIMLSAENAPAKQIN